MFAAVLKKLPDRVEVYPTENYYYFRFTQNGVVYVGNIRLGAADRDRGKVDFAYNEQPTDWYLEPAEPPRQPRAASRASAWRRPGRSSIGSSHAGKTVTFALNDLSAVQPPA